MISLKLRLINAFRALFAVLSACVLSFILLFFMGRVLADFKDIEKSKFLRRVVHIERSVTGPVAGTIRDHLPTNFRGKDVTNVYMILLALALLGVFSQVGARLFVAASRERKRLDEARGRVNESLQDSLRKMADGKTLERDKMLELYAHAKKSLEAGKTHLSFLSVDIVDSTGMKKGEEAADLERDFRRYKTMVEEILKRNHALKEAWTPDGIMICFGDSRSSILAGQEILTELKRFNREVKSIKKDFVVRVGINSGDVMFIEETPMEEMADRSIDIAGHMQKHCTPGRLWVSQHTVEPLIKDFPFNKNGKVVDGCPVFEWAPEA